MNGAQVLRDTHESFVVDFAEQGDMAAASLYELPFEHVREKNYSIRMARKEARQQRYWWLHARPSPRYRQASSTLDRCLATPNSSKHRIFLWIYPPSLADHALTIFLRDDDYFFGVLHSRVHEVWSRARGTQVRERESGFRYTAGVCFETFPFPEPFAAGLHEIIGEAAKEIDAARNRWLKPLEWIREDVVEFPGSVNGPWSRLVRDPDGNGVGTVRYVRRVPKDSKCAERLKERTLTGLYNERPTWLDLVHRRLDEAVFAAYGWRPDITDEEILARLLKQNLEVASTSCSLEQELTPKPTLPRLPS